MKRVLLQKTSLFPLRSMTLLHPAAFVSASRSIGSSFDSRAMVPVGKHKGRTYDDLMQNEPMYCKWLLSFGGGGPLAEFAAHLKSNQGSQASQAAGLGSEVLRFGKHRGKSFEAIMVDDPPYLAFVRRAVQEEGTGNQQMLRFAEFLDAQQANPPSTEARSEKPASPTNTQVSATSPALRQASWTLKVGKHKGRTFQEVYEEEKNYCEWVLKQDSSGPLGNFVEYVRARDATPAASSVQSSVAPVASASAALSLATREVRFGKHKGKTYEALVQEDASYCEWVLKSATDPDSKPYLKELASFIQARAES
mmetsp:Transcript_5130/g.11383  ORF Transcript_5130/g.11383 Transcript_5130/m.11383 type:complete len:309 (-) Transcript_5130:196-1122(-)